MNTIRKWHRWRKKKKTLILLVKKAFIAPPSSFVQRQSHDYKQSMCKRQQKMIDFLIRFFSFLFSQTNLNYQKLITYYFLPSKLEQIKVIWLCSKGIQARHSHLRNYLEGMLHHPVNQITHTHTQNFVCDFNSIILWMKSLQFVTQFNPFDVGVKLA